VTLSADEVRSLPAVIDVVTAAEVLGIGRTVAYQLIRAGAFPTPVLRVGGQVKIPTAPLLELLGIRSAPP
jgi:excisionase family DNA binding protein